MTNEPVKYSIIIPVLNAGEFLGQTVKELHSFTECQKIDDYEVILVDDGSTDNSWEVIKGLTDSRKNTVGVKLRKNFGQHNATCAGISKARGTFVITMDDDLEFDLAVIQKLIATQLQKGADVVYGSFDKDNRSMTIKLTRSFYAILSRAIGGKNQVKGSSLRLMKRDLAKRIAERASNFVFIDEVVFWYTERIEFVPIKRIEGLRKKSNYTSRKLLSLGLDVVLYSSLLPLRVIKRIGLFISVFMFFLGLFFIIKYLTKGVGVEGFTALIVTIAFSTGFIIYTLGTLGEYIGKIFRNVNNAPVYSIEEEIQ